MAPDQDYHKFPRGERCADCKAKRWYLESGRKYCENGHRIEGEVQLDIDQDDNFGQNGHTARKKKQAKKEKGKKLSGLAGRRLYFLCLTVMLRKQITWLIEEKGVKKELESICQDLWDLRIREFMEVDSLPGAKQKSRKAKNNAQSQSSSDGEAGTDSSQAETEATTDDEDGFGLLPKEMDEVEQSSFKKWSFPRPIETLAVVYVGCQFQKEAIRIVDIVRWAEHGQLPLFKETGLPPELLDRLPTWVLNVLSKSQPPFKASALHKKVMTLMVAYQYSYGMEFPGLRPGPLLRLYIRELALPTHVRRETEKFCTELDVKFSFPTTQLLLPKKPNEIGLLDLPDVLLVGALVLVTKRMCPFDNLRRYPRHVDGPVTLRMDWAAWAAVFSRQENKGPGQLDFENMEPEKIQSLSKDDMDKYLDWYQGSKNEREGPAKHQHQGDIENLFPLQGNKTQQNNLLGEESEVIARTKRVQAAMSSVVPLPPPEYEGEGDIEAGIESSHQKFWRVEDLVGTAKLFYEKAAEISGLSTKDLLYMVCTLEDMDERSRE